MILSICIFILFCCVLLNCLNPFTKRNDKYLKAIPGPPGYPIIGNILQFLTTPEKLWIRIRKLNEKYYPIYKTYQFSSPSVVLQDPEDMKLVLSSSTHISKGKMYEPAMCWLRTGLLTSTGKKWQLRRKLLTPAFHFSVLQEFQVIFNEHSRALVRRLENECSKPFTNVVPIVSETTLQLISETAMGIPLKTNDEASLEYINSVYRIGELIMASALNVLYQVFVTAVFTSLYWEIKRELKILHEFTTGIINKRKEMFEGSKIQSKRIAMLDSLIKAQRVENSIGDDGIREEVDTFMFEGHDTTSACISFTLMALANHPDIQNKVVDELKEIFGNSDRMPTFQDLQKMTYLEQVLKESLRLYPSVYMVARTLNKDLQTSTNYTIPKGTQVELHIFDMHRNEHIYPDPEKFDPERFSTENSKDRHPFAYVPFSAGPRNCIGQKFAFLELKTIISTILRHFELLPVDVPSEIIFTFSMVLKSVGGIRVKFLKRL